MTSFIIFAYTLTALFATAMTALTLRALAAERRSELARQARVLRTLAEAREHGPSAAMYSLADRRKTVATEVAVERRAA